MYLKKQLPYRTQAHALAAAAAGDLASTICIRPSHQTDLLQKNVLQVIDRIFDLLEVEFSEVSLLVLTRALRCVLRRNDALSEENVIRVVDRTFEVMDMEFPEFETDVCVTAGRLRFLWPGGVSLLH